MAKIKAMVDTKSISWDLVEVESPELSRGCDETMFAVMEKHGDVYSNIQPDPEFRLQDINRSIKHTFLDFGDDDFTNGKPHPMIDPTNRISRLIEEARDPEVAVIVMDFVVLMMAYRDRCPAHRRE